MKKIFLVFLFFFPFFVHASSRYDIESWEITAEILENGDLRVQENMILNGSYTSFSKDFYYRNSAWSYGDSVTFQKDAIYNGRGIQNITVKAKALDKEQESVDLDDLELLQKAYYQEDAKNKEYVESSMQDGKNLNIFFESNYDRVLYSFSYTISNVVVMHQDIAEFFWEFVRDDFKDEIDFLTIKILLPKRDPSFALHYFSHGDRNASQQCFHEQEIVTVFKRINRNNAISVRVTFDKKMISETLNSKKTHEVALEQILKLEENNAIIFNKTHEKNEKITYGMESVCIAYLIFFFFFLIFVYLKFVKEYKVSSDNLQEPFFSSVAFIDIFWNGKLSENAFLATILDLILDDVLLVKETKDDISFEWKGKDNLSTSEEILYEFLFEKVTKKKIVSLTEICSYIVGEKSSKVFSFVYDNWERCILKDAERENFYESNGFPVIASIFLFLISVFIFFATIYFNVPIFLPTIVLLVSSIFFFYAVLIRKRSKKGSISYAFWKDLKKQMKEEPMNFSKEQKKRYYVYAILFHMPSFGGDDVGLLKTIYDRIYNSIQKTKN